MPTVSVIIPTYNHRAYVLETLESVFAQTFTDYEVIVVNDGSPDDTAELLRPLAAQGRIRYIEQPNAGQAAARNRGLAEARGEFIAFLDDDDLWPPDKLEWQVAELRARPGAAAIGGLQQSIVSGRLEPLPPTLSPQPVSYTPVELFSGNPFFSPGQVLVRAELARAINGFDDAIWGADDLDFWIRLAGVGACLRFDRPSLHYRLHATNASRNLGRMFTNSLKVIRKNLERLPKADQREARRRGHEWLYHWMGHRLLSRASGGLTLEQRLAHVRFLIEAITLTPTVRRPLLRDLSPHWAREWYRRHRRPLPQ